MSIAHFFRILWARRNLVLVTTLSAICAAILVISLVPPRYTATSRLMLDIAKPDPVTGQTMSSQFMNAYVQTQIELIKDYRVAGRVVDQFNWTSSPELAAAYQATNPGRDMSFRRWLAGRVIEGTDARLVLGSNILEISYTTDQPENAASVADALREAYEAETRLSKQRGAQRSAEWFQSQTESLRAKLAEAEEAKANFERENNIVLEDNMTDAESSRLAAMAGVQDMPAVPSMPAAMPMSSPSQAQVQQLDVAIETAMRTLGPNHPRLVALRQQRAAAAQSAQQELAAARAAARAPVVSSGPSASEKFAAQRAKVLGQRGKVAEARQLAVNALVLREQVEAAAKRTVELQQESESTETGMSFLGNAVAPGSPSFPKIPLIVIGSIAMGLAFGMALAVLVELLNRRVRAPSDLAFEGIPVLGIANLQPLSKSNAAIAGNSSKMLPFFKKSAT
ncbi:Wzz/FepE/Etk N-terminal domain-containing protein [Qipengyuania sp.]|uniref:Wzz/FepE/Etk N-terminal domain-containing protein n=1 Tax=Qipengyuania sp. TaxID=2004515 RepID=UPI0035C78ED7